MTKKQKLSGYSPINYITKSYIINIKIIIGIKLLIQYIYKDFAKQRYNTPYACNVI